MNSIQNQKSLNYNQILCIQIINHSDLPITEKLSQISFHFIRFIINNDLFNVKYLLQFQSPNFMFINIKDNIGKTPLMYSTIFNHYDITELLLLNNANPNIKDDQQWTCLTWALLNNHTTLIQLLKNHNATNDIKLKSNTIMDDTMEMIDNYKLNQDFDWDHCKVDEMFVFDESNIISISSILIKHEFMLKFNYIPMGANIIFLCARYACYLHSNDLTHLFLNSMLDQIIQYFKSPPEHMFPYLYWLSNSFQLLIYLKRDTTLLVNTFEFQCKLTDFMDDLYQLFHNYLHHLTKLLIHSCIIQYQNEDYLKNIKYDSEFFGFNRRKTELKSIDDFESKLLKHQEFEMQHLNQTIFNNETDITIKQHIIKMKIILNQYYQNNDPSHISRLDKLNQIPIDEFNPQFIIIITQLILLFSQTCLLDESMMTQILKRYTENFIHQMFLSIIKDRYLMSRMKSKQIHHHIIYIKTTIQHTLKDYKIDFDIIFKPLINFLLIIQNVTNCKTVMDIMTLTNENPTSILLIHKIIYDYRYEIDEMNFNESIQDWIQQQIQSIHIHTEIDFIKNQFYFQLDCLNLTMLKKIGNLLLWNQIPFIPQWIVEMMDDRLD